MRKRIINKTLGLPLKSKLNISRTYTPDKKHQEYLTLSLEKYSHKGLQQMMDTAYDEEQKSSETLKVRKMTEEEKKKYRL